jgi:hypothetical protein
MIIELCDQLLLELEESKSSILSYLQPGISKIEVDSSLKLANIGVFFPDEVYSLYGWKNGINEDTETKTLGELWLFKLGIFCSLDLAISNYLEWTIGAGRGSKTLFPLFESGGGDYYFIETNKHSVSYGMILYYSPSNPDLPGPTSIFDSLDSCLGSIVECYRQKAYYYNPDSSDLEIVWALERAIWKKLNPNSEYYKILDSFK